MRGAKCPLCHEASHARLLINRLLVRDPYSSYTHCSLPTTHFLSTHTKQATCSLSLTNSYNMLHWRCRSGTDPIPAPKPWLSATRSLRLIQNPQPHPGHRLINSALPQPLHNQHFRNYSFRSTLTPVSATLTKYQGGGPASPPQSLATRHSPFSNAAWPSHVSAYRPGNSLPHPHFRLSRNLHCASLCFAEISLA